MRHQGAVATCAQGRDNAAAPASGESGGPAHDDVTGAAAAVAVFGERSAPVIGFAYVDGELRAEDVPLSAVADRFGTPCYVYSRALVTTGLPHLRRRVRRRCRTSSATRSRRTRRLRSSICSRGSAAASTSCPAASSRACIAAGGDPRKVVFSGVGKSDAEMEAALAAGILCFNVESASELEHLAAVAAPDAACARRSACASIRTSIR